MRRREFITLLGSIAVSPHMARAQTAGAHPLVGCLLSGAKEAYANRISAFLDGMRDLGYIEGQTFDIAYRYADTDYARLPALAEELVQLKPNVIVADATPATLATKRATQSIPIVCALLVDPVQMGIIASDARPGGNVTGILIAVEGLSSKQVEIIAELIPGITKIGLLVNPTNPADLSQQQEIEVAGTARGIKIVATEARGEADFDPAFKLLAGTSIRALIVARDAMFVREGKRVAELAVAARLPTVFGISDQVEAGGLIGYGINVPANFRRVAYFVDKILKGTNPGDLPVEFPTKLELVVNLKTAKAIGLTVPPTLLARADKVIE